MVHLTVTFTNLSGSRENLDKTIRALLEDNWTASNITGTITPAFESDTEEPDQLARPDNSYVNAIRISIFSRERAEEDGDYNGDDKHLWKFRLLVECQAEDLTVLLDFEDEINRILWENRPNSATRLNKSNGSASEAAFFEKSEIQFNRLEPQAEDDQTPTSQGELLIYYWRIKT